MNQQNACQVCGAECHQRPGDPERKFCSRKCYWKSREGHPVHEPGSAAAIEYARRASVAAAEKIRGTTQSKAHIRRRIKPQRERLERTKRLCTHCNDEYVPSSNFQLYCSSRCWLAVHRRKRETRPPRFTITKAVYDARLEQQGGVCAICNQKSKARLSVDHCHSKNHFRGLLCHRCNTAIGLLRDDVGILERAIHYLTNTPS